MNTLTRGEKIDMALENAKRVAIKGLLILWAVFTVAMTVGCFGNHVAYKQLEEKYQKIESEYQDLNDHVEAIYVYRR